MKNNKKYYLYNLHITDEDGNIIGEFKSSEWRLPNKQDIIEIKKWKTRNFL